MIADNLSISKKRKYFVNSLIVLRIIIVLNTDNCSMYLGELKETTSLNTSNV